MIGIRVRRGLRVLDDEQLQQGFRLGDWAVRPARQEISRGDETQSPPNLVFRLFMAVVRRNGDIVSRDELVDEVWDGRAVGEDVIDQTVSQLRKALDDRKKPNRYIQTVPKVGFRLVADIEFDTAATETREPGQEAASASPPPPVARSPWPRSLLWVAVIAVLAWILWPPPPPPPPPANSIAVLPFSQAADNGNDVYVVGFREVLVERLHSSGQYTVKTTQQPFSGDVQETAASLGVSHVLTGSLQILGDEVQVQYEMIEGATGRVVSVSMVNGKVSGLFALQEELANRVHTDLIGPDDAVPLDERRPPDADAYRAYLQGLYAFDQRIEPGRLEEAIRRLEETVAVDPAFAPGWLRLAYAYALLPDNAPVPVDEWMNKAIDAATRAADEDPELRNPASAVLGFANYKRRNWALADQFFRESIEGSIADASAHHLYSRMLSGAGLLDDALAQAMAAATMSPTSPSINSRIALIHTWRGDTAAASEYFDRSARYGAGGPTHFLGYAIHLFRAGDFDAAKRAIESGVGGTGLSADWVEPVFAAVEDPALRE